MSAKVLFLSKETDSTEAQQKPLLAIPLSSVVSRNGQDVVLLLRDDTISEVPVKTGMRLGDKIEIREGLMDRDRIVLRPTPELTSGMKVKPKS